jgi:hypothetical protein
MTMLAILPELQTPKCAPATVQCATKKLQAVTAIRHVRPRGARPRYQPQTSRPSWCGSRLQRRTGAAGYKCTTLEDYD